MCGIVGVVNLSSRETVQRMASVLAHRGPDDEGYYVDEGVSIGMRRLSIIDPSPLGHQPMGSEDGRTWVVYNGEIYNYQDLNAELQGRGHVVRSNCDTEAIVHLYEELREDCVLRLRGMFAFAVWHSASRTLFAARDRLGIKPFYYARLGEQLVFASELKAIIASGLVSREMNPVAMWHYLSFGSVPAPWTIWKDVRALPPGHRLTFREGVLTVERYWDAGAHHGPAETSRLTKQEAATEVRRLLDESVRLQLRSDVPLGAFLSGGLDSSAVVGLMSQGLPAVETFSVGYDVGAGDYDERRYAASASRHFRTNHHEVLVSGQDVAADLDRIIWHMDQPSHDALNSYFVARAAASGVKVALSGMGGDELFGGYSTFRFSALLRRWQPLTQALPAWVRQSASALEHRTPLALRAQWPVRVGLGIAGGYDSIAKQFAAIRFFFSDMEKTDILAPAFLDRVRTFGDVGLSSDMLDSASDRALDGDEFNRMAYLELTSYMADTLLRDTDVMSMAHSLEVRVPLLDDNLVEFVMSLPGRLKAESYRDVKSLLKESVRDLVPPMVLNRRKMGFGFPMPIWMRRGPLRDVVEDCLSESSIRGRGIFSWPAISKVAREFYDRPQFGNSSQVWLRLWVPTVVELWCRSHLDGPGRPSQGGILKVDALGRSLPSTGTATENRAPCTVGTGARRPRVLLLARVFPPRKGGIETLMYNVYSRLAADADVTVITPTWPEWRSFDSGRPIRVVRTPVLPRARDRYETPLIGMLAVAWKEALNWRPDQIHCDQVHSAIAGRALGSALDRPFLVWALGLEVTDNRLVALKRWAVSRASTVVAISNDTGVRVQENWGLSADRIRLIHPGVDVNRFHPGVSPARILEKHGLEGKKIILTTGRLAAGERYKGHDSVIECMPDILREVPNACYLIVGDGPDKERLRSLARKHGVADRVVLVGTVPDEDLPEYYAACDVFVMASREARSKSGGLMTEGFGIVFVEAAAAGKPTIGTRVGGIPDAVDDGITGLLVDPNDRMEMACAIVKIIEDEHLARRLGLAGRIRAEQSFQWGFAAQKVLSIAKELGDHGHS